MATSTVYTKQQTDLLLGGKLDATTYRFQVLVYTAGAYPARPSATISPAGWVKYSGPVQPTDWLVGDEWVNNA